MRSSDPATVSRRAFVRTLGVAGAAFALSPRLRAHATDSAARERSLVLIHLAGGNDGWSTFAPWDDDAYHRARPTLALRRRDLLPLGERVWLNRAATDLKPLWERGELAVVPRAGFTPGSLSHFRATQIWCGGGTPEEVPAARWFERCQHRVVVVPGDFSAALAQVAVQVESDRAGAIYFVRLEGFDTHFDQWTAHDAVIGAFARGVAGFQRQLARGGTADRVLTLAFSEFGRALAENEFGGTHHGESGQCYFVGAGVRGGMHGANDAIAPPAVDYRRVIESAAEGWLGLPARLVVDGQFTPLPVLA